MQYLYPQDFTTAKLGQKFYWGSLYGSAKALALIEFALVQKRVLLIVAPDINYSNSIYKSLSFYNKNLDILIFDSYEVLAYDNFSPHIDIISNRLKTLSKLQNLTQGIVITTLESLLQYIPPLDFITKYSLTTSVGSHLNIELFSKKLIQLGYKKVFTVMERGEFNVKGSLIDVYPMGTIKPYRIDLFDEEVESIRSFDLATQRSLDVAYKITLLPTKEFPVDEAGINVFKDNYVNFFSSTTDFIYTEVVKHLLPGGIEFYLPLFFTNTIALLDYLPQNAIVVTEQGFNTLVDETYDFITARYEAVKLNLHKPPLKIDKVFLRKEQLFAKIKQKQQLVIKSSKLKLVKAGLNFGSTLLPAVQLQAQAKKPLFKLLNFIDNFSGKTLIVCESIGRKGILNDLLINNGIYPTDINSWQDFVSSNSKLCISCAELSEGLLTKNIAIITEANLFGQDIVNQQRRRRAKHKDFDEAIKSLVEIKKGNPIVHENYGIGRYLGLKTYCLDGVFEDMLVLEYAGGSRLMVPMTSLNLISRYSGVNVDKVPLHRLGSSQWLKAKKKASEALHDIAAELLDIYARRKSQKGFAFPKPTDAYSSFIASFEFEETPDQIKTMDEVLADMQADKPMDRLVCGDVGFGKTEIAMRAAFLAVEANKQVVILVPTTLLASQHYQSFIDRFANYPLNIATLSRFQTASEQRQIKVFLLEGKIDIVIGTHKLIQKDIRYKRLGLVIIDEEHRFGVKQKESLKNMRSQSDILTMTATPIPRTLNMALGSLKELSIIATPPAKRRAIKTFVDEWNNDTIKEACVRELRRGGQIFFVHNDIDSIDNMAEELKSLIPDARVLIAHGQMPTKELEHIMRDFYHGRFHVLVCTTIIETGIDIPNANTIIINNAQKFGLAQLHQLRGRVGRSHHLAYAYLVISSYQSLTKDAKKRLDAIESLKELGAGFMLANHDLEIRGAGNLLGDNQSGRINEIGFNLYHDLLKRTIEAMRSGHKINFDALTNNEIQISSGIATIIPETYLIDIHERLVLYKRIASARSNIELKDLQVEMIDRFGLLPDATKNLFAITYLRLFCEKIGVAKINIYSDKADIYFNNNTIIEPVKIIDLITKTPEKYKLNGQNQLVINKVMPANIKRIEMVHQTLLAVH